MPRGRKKQNSVADSEPGSVVYGVPRTFPETITSDSHDEAAKDAEIPGNTVHEPLRLEPSLADILQRTLGPPDKTEAGSPRADNLAVLLGKMKANVSGGLPPPLFQYWKSVAYLK